ncbi:peptide-methionine (S)-S-oxide reductase MsrA [Bdellovibrio svalbardensis]|uniref:Peptide methionine sulfoxide reductase MsrA n=1 Tax=Bdellovibrio svalbardensis TaxID=2972972 RepID=A0ABT6DL83_9BACT|nr:peptide-methionine (S)-S-oxide reductase MsrA [Bdellovibrio svalbardensis]MDG0817642.1 peptide-methionine (S)-S-oxide reductase MsrA [Bdellovibrio svalbardensis]
MTYLNRFKALTLLGLIFMGLHTHASTSSQTAILAGGCFWGMEEVYRTIPGVLKTEVGYTGGAVVNPTYEQVSRGGTGHAESLRVEFDPKKISYQEILKIFFRMHDPTSLNRQGNDIGTQYRSEIFYLNSAQKEDAEKVIYLVNQAKKWPSPVVTKLEPAKKFYPAEEYHQKYLVKNPHGYNDHYLRDFKF